jgi:UDPglucose--hexose-1-phosphate uridylyltransferase
MTRASGGGPTTDGTDAGTADIEPAESPWRKVSTRLSDGRELIYYDDPDSTLGPDRGVDEREPQPRPPTAVMRQDPLSGEWIAIAAARQHRIVLPPANEDPFAPSTPGHATEVPSDYDVVVFENKSPSFGPALPDASEAAELPTELDAIGLGRSSPAFGRCEVICFSPRYDGSLGAQGSSRVRTVVETWADRTAVLSALPGIAQVTPFENRGDEIGVTLRHPHGQIYAYPYITPRTLRLLATIDAYGADLFADILDFERGSERLLLEGEHFTAFVPFAARWPVEIHMLPHRWIPDLAATTPTERDELASIYHRLLQAVDGLYDTPTPYIAAWHQAPVSHPRRRDVRLLLKITSPRRSVDQLKYLAGSEASMGAFIGDIMPEAMAEQIRAALARTGG